MIAWLPALTYYICKFAKWYSNLVYGLQIPNNTLHIKTVFVDKFVIYVKKMNFYYLVKYSR